MHGVQNIKEVVARRTFILGICSGEVLGEVGILLKIWPEAAHRQLVVVGHLDILDLRLLEELLPSCEDILEEIFVDYGLIREVHLYYKEVNKNVERHLRC